MKAVVCRDTKLVVEDRPEPVPGEGQVLLEVLRCGICGSDLHARHHCGHMGTLYGRMGYSRFPSSVEGLVFGHELAGEVLEYGKGCTRKLPVGTRVCAMPMIRNGSAIDLVGLSPHAPGAYAERVVVEESMMLAVPNGLSVDLAALTEPMAVAWHAVRRSEIGKKDVAIVIGCGPVGLATICMLKARGTRTIVASDFSAGRRALAKRCGADVVVDPANGSPFAGGAEHGFVETLPGLFELAVGTREKLGKLPLPWWQTWRLVEGLGLDPKRPVVFECVGVPGVLQGILEGAPLFSRVVVVGVCMQEDRIEPAIGIHKELDLRFVFGYSPLEFRDTLHLLAEGRVACAPLVTGHVGLAGVESAFSALGDPEVHAKILIDPKSPSSAPTRAKAAA